MVACMDFGMGECPTHYSSTRLVTYSYTPAGLTWISMCLVIDYIGYVAYTIYGLVHFANCTFYIYYKYTSFSLSETYKLVAS